MNNKFYIGIDPGISGGLTCMWGNGVIKEKIVMPITKVGTRNKLDAKAITRWLKTLSAEGEVRMVGLEEQRPMHKQGVTSTFTTGRGYGTLEGIVTALDLPYEVVRPTDWQREMFKGKPKGNTKVYSKEIAQQLFPGEEFRKNDKCKNLHDGLTDSTLIAEHIRRKIK